MYFLMNDLVLDLEPARMMQPLDADRFSALSIDYIAQLGKEMFAEDALIHRKNPERARRLAYLIQLKMPRINAAQFFVMAQNGQPESVDASFKSLNDIAMGAMFAEQSQGHLDAQKVDQQVWHRLAA